MKVHQSLFFEGRWLSRPEPAASAQLILAFGSDRLASDAGLRSHLRDAYPKATFVGCTSAGEIHKNALHDKALSVTALAFADTQIKSISLSRAQGCVSDLVAEIAAALVEPSLRHVLVFADSAHFSGDCLARELNRKFPESITVSGGLAGKKLSSGPTRIWHGDDSMADQLVACGFYGDHIDVRCSSVGGWEIFGPKRKITKSENNVLYELDGKPALALYKQYLGLYAEQFPKSGLLFPLNVRVDAESQGLVRTLLDVDEATGAMFFAGELPLNASAQLMRASADGIIDGAWEAANATEGRDFRSTSYALAISCVCRRLILKQRTEDELDAIEESLGSQCAVSGFYSHGEIAPFAAKGPTFLHNQTMTITRFSERKCTR